MRITKENATFSQNKFNFYIGNIDTTETILIDSSFIIVGNIKTSKNILAEYDLIVIGNIDAKSLYICKDLLCTGKINTEISEVDGKFKILEKDILEKSIKQQILQTRKDKELEFKACKSDKENIIKPLEVENQKDEIYTKYKRITKEKDLNEGDIVIHNSLGEGKFISMSKDKIKIDFKIKGTRAISKNVTFKLALLKKKIENEVYHTKKDNTLKEEYMANIDNGMGKLKSKKNLKQNTTTCNKELINNKYKNKAINFYIKDINSYIIESKGQINEIHYIKYNDCIFVRLNQICSFLNVNLHLFDNCISNYIKVSYYGKCINGIKFIDISNILDNKNFVFEKLEYYNSKCLDNYSILLETLENINIDGKNNLHNATPYLRYIIDDILKNKKISIEQLAKEWNVSVENIEFIRLGFTSPLSKFKQLIKDNKVENPDEHKYKIREIKSRVINVEKLNENRYINDESLNEVDKVDIITNKIYELLEQYNYDVEDISIENIEIDNSGKYLIDINIKYMISVSNTVSLMEYLSCKISELTKEYVKLSLCGFNKEKFISEIMEVSLNSLKKDTYSNKYYITTDVYDLDMKKELLEENKDYIKSLTGYNIELILDNKKIRTIQTIEQRNSDRTYSQVKTKTLRYDKPLEEIGKDDITKLLLKQNIAFKNEDINEFECSKIKKSYSGYTFDYIKYNGKIYIRAGQISNILNLDINRLYPYLKESIKIRYINSYISNAKFSSTESILNAIKQVQYVYPDEKLSEHRVELITKCIDDILISSKNLDNSIPYWRLVLEHMMFNLNISIKELNAKWGISSYDIELMSLGFSPSNIRTRELIKEEINL